MFKYDLDIKFGFGQIDINTYMGELSLKKGNDSGFDIKTQGPDISISNNFPEIDIDTSACWADIGYLSPCEFGIQSFHKAVEEVDEYIYGKVAEGNALADIEKGITVQDAAYDEATPEPREVNVDIVPKSRPRISVREGVVTTDFTPGRVLVSVDTYMEFEFKRASVNISLAAQPYINIKAVEKGANFDIIA
jgi:hypothetical protein